ncbi:major facilitator superfamily domain-containing protein [Aspergillus multicolor]|uniref:major facilitator superfamily domain-containing protein n=1 Tax=Aspergillus multicolor TaxID=41759 RepID=UPI003CCCA436
MIGKKKAEPGPPDIVPAIAANRDGDIQGVVAQKTKGADALLTYLDQSDAVVLDEATDRRLLRKVDTHILPWLCCLYILQYLDKGVLSYAAVMGLLTDANLTSSQYSWLGSIYYLGYMVALPIHNRLFQVFLPSKYIAANMVLWGLVLSLMTVCNDFTSMMIQRAFLGTLEAVVNCGFVLLTARWYKKYEHGARVAIWGSCNGLATMVGALIAFGCLSSVEDGLPVVMPSWKIMALCLGLVSIVYGAVMWYFMAPSLLEAKFFTEEEKTQAIERLRGNHQGIGSTQFKWDQAREALLDMRTWLYVLFVLTSQIPSGGVVLLSSLLFKSLNFTSKESLLLNIPGGALQIIFQLTAGFVADRTKQRSLTALTTQLISLFAASLLIGLGDVAPLNNVPGQLAAYFLMIGACAIAYYLVFAMVASNVLGTTKKTTTNVILFLAMAVAYLVGPQVFRDPPYYYHGKYATVGLWGASVIILVLIYVLNRWENGKRDWEDAIVPEGVEFMDLTDKQNRAFRYVL